MDMKHLEPENKGCCVVCGGDLPTIRHTEKPLHIKEYDCYIHKECRYIKVNDLEYNIINDLQSNKNMKRVEIAKFLYTLSCKLMFGDTLTRRINEELKE